MYSGEMTSKWSDRRIILLRTSIRQRAQGQKTSGTQSISLLMTLNVGFRNCKDEPSCIEPLDVINEHFTMNPREVAEYLRNCLESKVRT